VIFNWGKKKQSDAAQSPAASEPKAEIDAPQSPAALSVEPVEHDRKGFFSGLFGKKDKADKAASPEEAAAIATLPPAASGRTEQGGQMPVIGEPLFPHDHEPILTPEPQPEPVAISEAVVVEAAHAEADPPEASVPPGTLPKTLPETPPQPLQEPLPATTHENEPSVATAAKRDGFFARLTQGLARSSSKLGESVTALFTRRKLDKAALAELEDLLILSDLGTAVAARVVAKLAETRFDREVSATEIREALAETIAETLKPLERDIDLSGHAPQVIMFVGVNGSGKTTTLGKIAALIAGEGRSVMMAAGDTFRAAAIEQLQIWGQRAGSKVIARAQGADAAGLVFDAHEEAVTAGADVLLIDTAGRLQNKAHLMEELRKIVRVLKKRDGTAPHHVLLVLDGTVGQNALSQVKVFREVANVTGLIITKLDSTAKGGVLVAIAEAHPDLPIYFTGVGEALEDLAPFNAEHFARALTGVVAGPRA
jgi:fused signal recognition particle receptor